LNKKVKLFTLKKRLLGDSPSIYVFLFLDGRKKRANNEKRERKENKEQNQG